ncbi:hypothetical protein EIP91_009112 [Steccherinum ochraceum]|uniref:SHSP domain-containing protein n=1 Tax=Steccherinum ochraceum TaxID=92696 RepID=A0A4R0R7L3_9APHY|nr:hypothetical protein EIP91_009112 [Steccherinum ochraceum]
MDSPASLYARRHSEPLVPYLTPVNPSNHISPSRDQSTSPSIRSKHLLADIDSARADAECSARPATPPTPSSSLGSTNGMPSSDNSDALSIRSVHPDPPSARNRRAPPECDTPPMHVHSTNAEHTLDVWLPKELSSEMVTVSAKKGNRLSIVADVWYRETNSHYEWDIVFPPRDVDMNQIRVSLAQGHVIIRACRRRQSLYF